MSITARPPRVLSVLHVTEETGVHPENFGARSGQTWYERDETSYYAVVQPHDAWDRWNEGEEPNLSNLLDSPAYALFGGQPVYIHDQSDIDGLRKLLDAIEADLKEIPA